ncbi:MAG: chromophore lyase CpcT/CpeT [Pseudomonadota bacterium]
MMIRTFSAAAGAIALAACAHADGHGHEHASVEELAEILTGSFTTLEQSATDGWGYVESELARIWPEREDGVWLYQENVWLGDNEETADWSAKERPYFQRIVRLVETEPGVVLRTIYRVEDAASLVGAYADPSRVGEDQLAAPNCSGPVERIAHGWWVADFPTCPSNLRGAVRTHSRSIHTPDGFANWDRGIDPQGNVVWGPAEAGYIFKRKADEE